MRILLLRHYPLSESPSMRAYADQIAAGLRGRGHQVRELTAPVVMARLAGGHGGMRKWLGYLDQFVIFPPLLWLNRLREPASSLWVFADQALGPWIPMVRNRAHLVHVHDLLALEGALGQQPFHQVPWSGRIYQRWIRHGFRLARCFIAVSAASREALNKHLLMPPLLSEVLHNPLHSRFVPIPSQSVVTEITTALPQLNLRPYLFHIGRNWYKNRLGVLEIWEQLGYLGVQLDLILVGSLDPPLAAWIQQRPALQSRLHVLPQASDQLVLALYNCAEALLFPSHAEGFGWPILEAMACGCPVITTDRPPMSEIAADVATLLPPYAASPESHPLWARHAARSVQAVLQRSSTEREHARRKGLLQASRFAYAQWLDQLELHYRRALALQNQC
jgi:glycosyltransferase involved in cell wall biosynthesis